MDQTSELEKQLQEEKYNEIIELLLSAGYFRARISNLNRFDKVVGGLCWCITSSGENVDVDLLFQENSSIGQQISLTEAIVLALRKMGCPHQIQPHQIQGGVGGADYLVISKVILWLIKKYFEVKIERETVLKNYSIYQFNKNYTELLSEFSSSSSAAESLYSGMTSKKVSPFLFDILNEQKIQRLYKKKYNKNEASKIWKNYSKEKREEELIFSCFFEYNEKYSAYKSGSKKENQEDIYNSTLNNLSRLDMNELSGFEKQLAKITKEMKKEEEEEHARALQINKKLVNEMENDDKNSIENNKKNLNNLINKDTLIKEYENYKKNEQNFDENEDQEKIFSKVYTKKLNHQKIVTKLNEKLEKINETRKNRDEIRTNLIEEKAKMKGNYKEMLNYSSSLDLSIEKLKELESNINNNEDSKKVYEKIKRLIQLNEVLKKKMSQNKKNYKKKMKILLKNKKKLKIKINKKYYDYFNDNELNLIQLKPENEIKKKESLLKSLQQKKLALVERKYSLLSLIKNNNNQATALMNQEMEVIEKEEEELESEEDKYESEEELSDSEDERIEEKEKIEMKKKILRRKKITSEELTKIKEEKNILSLYTKTITKYNEIKRFISKTNQEINSYTRIIDDTPSRGELIQYERRFNELYTTSANKLAETRKYYEVYNNLTSKLNFIQKEIKLLDSISNNFTQAMKSKDSKVEFMNQFELIVKGVEDSLTRQEIICKQKQEVVDEQKSKYQQLVDQQRSYYKAVKDFQEECNKNEWLSGKFQELQRK